MATKSSTTAPTIIPVEGHDNLTEIRVGRGRSGSTVVKKDGATEAHASKGAALLKYKLKEVKCDGGGTKAVPNGKKKPAAKKGTKTAA